MTSEDASNEDGLGGIAEGLDREGVTLTDVIKTTLSGSNVAAARETVGFVKRLVTEETPENPDLIMELSKDDVIIMVYRINLFEKLRLPVVDDEQINQLYQRALDLWGESPTEPIGRWVEWNLWVTRHRRKNGIPITEVIEEKKTVAEIKDQWVKRHQDREEQRKLRKIENYEKYDVPEDVPSSLHHLLFSPFIQDRDEVPEVELNKKQAGVEDPERER
jgi:hypothetical protein